MLEENSGWGREFRSGTNRGGGGVNHHTQKHKMPLVSVRAMKDYWEAYVNEPWPPQQRGEKRKHPDGTPHLGELPYTKDM